MFDVLVAGEINPDLIVTGDIVPEFGQVEREAAESTTPGGLIKASGSSVRFR